LIGTHFACVLRDVLINDLFLCKASQLSAKIKSTYKLKASGRNLFKGQSVSGHLISKYEWHKDGLWYITTALRQQKQFMATASAGKRVFCLIVNCYSNGLDAVIDGTACVCDVTKMDANISPFLSYVGHSGCSVNCIKFHPNYDLIMTAGGDGSTHIWRPNLEHVLN